MELNVIYSILGIIGGLLGVIGDLLFDLKGKDNQEIGKLKMINSNWKKMNKKRFYISIMLVLIGVPLFSLGEFVLSDKINDELLSNLFKSSIVIGAMGGFFIHTIVCIIPPLYCKIAEKDEEVAEEAVNTIWDNIKVPFLLLYVILVPVSSIIIITAILNGSLEISKWCILLTPMCLQIIGLLLRKINNKVFYEVPSIFMGSLGMAMYGLMGLL